MRILWITAGLALVGVGSIGFVVPGLPGTVFFIGASWCFARSSPRLEKWLLGLPAIGNLITNYRAGLGMPRRAKVSAVTMIAVACSISAWTVSDRMWLAVTIVAVGRIGIWYVMEQVPTKEAVLAQITDTATGPSR